ELLRDGARVGHVVAVGRSAPRAEHGGEVEVADPELAQVGHERPGARERERRPELEAVGRAERGPAHVARRSRTSERPSSGSTSRATQLRGGASGSKVESSSAQCSPKRRGGSVKSTRYWWPLKRTRNESSTIGSP